MEWSGVELGGLVGMEGDACRGWWVGLWQGVGRGRGVQTDTPGCDGTIFCKACTCTA